jgi:hypothetical protein
MLEDIVTFAELGNGGFERSFRVNGKQRLEMDVSDWDDSKGRFGSG